MLCVCSDNIYCIEIMFDTILANRLATASFMPCDAHN